MSKKIALGIMLTLFSSTLLAKNLAVIGEVFPVKEPDLLMEIRAKLATLQQSGQMTQVGESMRNKLKKSLESPPAVPGVSVAKRNKVWYYDPSIQLAQDIRDLNGNIINKKGTIVNPLSYVTWHESLIFFNGSDKTQVAWAKHFIAQSKLNVKPILIAGNWAELMRAWQSPIYYDQNGALTKRFGIHCVPTIVSQEGKALKIEEVALT